MGERKWAIRRIDTGDYLLPSNDRLTLWRISVGEEPNERDAGKSVRVWELWRWRATPIVEEDVALSIVEHVTWEANWELVAQGLRTRTDAITEAMRCG